MINQITLDLFPSNKIFDKDSKIKLFEAFAGIGSQHQALKNLGLNVEAVGISEIDKYSIESYKAIHGNVKNYGSITDIKGEEMPKDIDIFTYSFPCQDLSVAGNGAGIKKGTRSGLLYEVERILKEMDSKPKVLLLENVKNLVGKNHKESFDVWLKELEDMGYENTWQVLNAKDYGIPQNRERVFVISILGGGNYNFPKPIELKLKLKDFIDFNFTKNEKIGGVQAKKKLEQYLKKSEKGKSFIYDFNESLKFDDGSKIRYENDISRTLVGRGSYAVCRNVIKKHILSEQQHIKVRKLTPKECWRLMGFKDEQFNKAQAVGISNPQLYKQAGNSIVVDVLEAIFIELFKDE